MVFSKRSDVSMLASMPVASGAGMDAPLSFAKFMAADLAFIGGLAYGATLLSVPTAWIVMSVTVALVVSVFTAAIVAGAGDVA